MDFFEAQARARRRTGPLVALFVLALLGTIAALYLAALFILALSFFDTDHRWWRPGLFGFISAGVLLVCGVASLSRWRALRAGGSAIVERVEGRPVPPDTTDLRERTLLNIVEEISLASGVPVPAVYVLRGEPGINAFAAGYSPADAALAVTDGALARLTRDELQGVIAHEFSHILNGDMRLNTRLSSLVFGILALSILGGELLSPVTTARSRPYRNRADAKGAPALALFFLSGLALVVIGYIGHLFGRLIQTAVSRQREYLADAAAVQFTRDPSGLGGALKKVGGTAVGGVLHHDHATEISHFCFVQNIDSLFLVGLFATHPPLENRIRSIEPGWDGHYLASSLTSPPSPLPAAPIPGLGATFPGVPPIVQVIAAADLLAAAGQLSPSAVAAERRFLDALPDTLHAAAHDTAQVSALCFALCLPRGQEPADLLPLLELISTRTDAATARHTATLRAALQAVPQDHHLSLLHLAAPALRQLEADAATRLLDTLDALIRADGHVSVREFALKRVLHRSLDLASHPCDAIQVLAPAQVVPELSLALTAAARIGAADETAAREAFARAAVEFNGLQPPLAYRPDGSASWDKLDAALERLAHTPDLFRKRILGAFATALTADARLSADEADLFRALAAALDCPLPPVLPVSAG